MTTLDWLAIGFAAVIVILWGGLVYRLISDYQELQRIRRNRGRR